MVDALGEIAMRLHSSEDFLGRLAETVIDVVVELTQFDALFVDQLG